jgi:hypothetical protein
MGRVFRVLLVALFLVACGDAGGGDPDLSVQSELVGESITLSIETDLPDDAVLTWDVWDEDPEQVDDPAHESGEVTVTAGQATAVVDATSFQEEAYITVRYAPDAPGQPDAVADEHDAEVRADTTVTVESE